MWIALINTSAWAMGSVSSDTFQFTVFFIFTFNETQQDHLKEMVACWHRGGNVISLLFPPQVLIEEGAANDFSNEQKWPHSQIQGQCQLDSAGVQGKGGIHVEWAPILSFTTKCSQQELGPNLAQTRGVFLPGAAAYIGHWFASEIRGPGMSRTGCSPGALQVLLLNRWENRGLVRRRDKTRARSLTEVNGKATHTWNVK